MKAIKRPSLVMSAFTLIYSVSKAYTVKMIGNETYVCATISQTIVNNNTIVISPREGITDSDKPSSDTFNLKRFESYDELPPPAHCSTPKAKGNKTWNDTSRRNCPTPISTWLDELRDCYIPECTTTLQSKSLMVDVNEKVKMLASLTSNVIRTLHHQTYSIAKEFDHIYRCLEMNCTKFIPRLVDDLINHMVAILLQHSDGYLELKLYQEVGSRTTEKLELGPLPHLVWQLNALALDFSKRIDRLLLQQMEVLVGVMNSIENPTALLTILSSFTLLGLQCDHLGSLLSRCAGISTLLQIGKNSSNSRNIRVLALKLLSSVLCAPSVIMYISENDGMYDLTAILSDDNRQLIEKRHTLAAIAQLSDPKYNVRVPQNLLSTIIKEETKLLWTIPCTQTLFLVAITLANFSTRKESVEPLIENSSVAVLLNAIMNQGPEAGVTLKDHAASIIANLSDCPQAIPHLCQNRVVPALLCFMNTDQNDAHNMDSPDYRLQHKCALALARLCSEKDAVSQLEQLKGLPKLLKLCKQSVNEKKNDHRLLACLEAIRRILAKNNQRINMSAHATRMTSITTH